MNRKVNGILVAENLLLSESFNNMDILRTPDHSVDAILRGLVDDTSQKVDNTLVDDVRNRLNFCFVGAVEMKLRLIPNRSVLITLKVVHFLFGAVAPRTGMDLVALNTQRGRDHGLPGYIQYREICSVGKVQSWDDLENNILKAVSWIL